MEDSYSVSSPRRILSLSKKRRASVSFQDPDEKLSGFRSPGDHGPKTTEVYGFVGSITTVVATAIFLIWAYVPESWLHSVGIFYYPSRYWALAVPTYAMVTVVLALGFYIGLNFISTPPPTSLSTIFDEFSREPATSKLSMEGDDQPIEPISDIGIDRINHLMFDEMSVANGGAQQFHKMKIKCGFAQLLPLKLLTILRIDILLMTRACLGPRFLFSKTTLAIVNLFPWLRRLILKILLLLGRLMGGQINMRASNLLINQNCLMLEGNSCVLLTLVYLFIYFLSTAGFIPILYKMVGPTTIVWIAGRDESSSFYLQDTMIAYKLEIEY